MSSTDDSHFGDDSDWMNNPTVMVSNSNKIKREKASFEYLTEEGQTIFQQFGKLDESRYTKLAHIAEGGGGSVSEYYDERTARTVAIKSLHSNESKDQEKLSFIKEALITANLEHPSIIPIHEIVLNDNDTPMYTMKKLNGTPLTQILTDLINNDNEAIEKYPIANLLQIFLRVCEACSYAHSQHVLHLDIKPENVMIGEFGDVLLMDWGLAEHFGDEYSTGSLKRIFNSFVDKKYEYHIHGTPGYMAPEQIEFGPDHFDQRTDIHGLGALLYSILTLRRPYPGGTLMEIIENTRAGNLPSPIKYEPKRVIPNELAAIALKAMSHSRENRYDTVDELKSDISSFLLGNAVSALKDSLLKKTMRIYRRYKNPIKLASTIILFCSLTAWILYSQYQKTKGSWHPNIDLDMSDYTAVKSTLFQVAPFSEINPTLPQSSVDKKGFSPGHNWIFVGQPGNLSDFAEDVKIELDFEWGDTTTVDAVEISFNSEVGETKPQNDDCLRGYSVQVASWVRQFNYISINNKQGKPNLLNCTPFRMPKKLRNKLTIERIYPDIFVYLNGKKIMEELNTPHFVGRPFGKIRLRCWDPSVKFKGLKVFTQKRAQLTSPLDVGDAFVTHHNYKVAAEEYLRVIKDIPKRDIRESAGKKYIQTLYTMLGLTQITHEQLLEDISFLQRYFWTEKLKEFYISVESSYHWENQRYDKALDLIKTVKDSYSQGRLAQALLIKKHRPLDDYTGQELLKLISQKTDLRSLDLTNLNLNSLEPLKNLKLEILKCPHNNITDLSPLRGMPLANLQIAKNRIVDLTPLRDMPLRQLDIDRNPIKTHTEYTQKTLEVFMAAETNLRSIDFLRGHPVSTLTLDKNPIISLEPLADAKQLTRLTIDNTDITDLTPLKNHKMTTFLCRGAFSSARSKLKSIPELDLSEMINLQVAHTELEILPDLSTLVNCDRLSFSNNMIKDISRLQTLPRKNIFKYIDLSSNPITDGSALKGIHTDLLDITNTKITDLSFLDEMQINHLPTFYNENLNVNNVKSIYQTWQRAQKYQDEVHRLQIVIDLLKKDYSKFRDYASKVNGKKYLFINTRLPYKKAAEIAKSSGGHLICFETKDEYQKVYFNYKMSLRRHNFFTGLKLDKDNTPYWITGEKLNWKLPSLELSTKEMNPQINYERDNISRRGEYYTNVSHGPQEFVIEFPNKTAR